jgi:soluble lytic murein transglycosylase-like protein
MKLKIAVVLSAAFLALLTAVPASAEIVFLTSGRTLSVKSHKVEGESIVLTLRGGGEVTCDKSLIAKIEADEVPYIDPDAAKPADVPAALDPAARPTLDGTPFAELIAAAAEAHGVDPLLVKALIQVESGYRPRARSPRGAVGLMQIMPATAREYKVGNPFDPKANIEAGVKHLKALLDRFGGDRTELALAAYNAGPGAVEKFNGIPPYRETRNYVTRILELAGLK